MPKGKVDVQRQIPELSAAGIFRKCKQRLNSATTLIVMVFLFVWLQQHLGAWLSVWNQQMNAQLHVCDGRAGHTHEETVGTREHENQHDCLHESPFLCDWSRLSVCTQACMSLRSICKCTCLYIDVCRCACLRVELHASTGGGGVSSDGEYVVQRAEYHRDTCHSTLLCRDFDPDKSTSTIVSILSWLQATDRALPNPRHPALTFLRAASPGEIRSWWIVGNVKDS